MSKPTNLKTKIFLDSGDPAETKAVIEMLGFLDGQTTNPTLITKNPQAKARFEKGEKFSPVEILDFYKQIVTEISSLIPNGSVSIEVYSDKDTKTEAIYTQALEMAEWIPNAHVKFPTTMAGLEAAEKFVNQGGWANLTLVFSQDQAAAVYLATKNAKPGDVFVSPFIGRLDDIGFSGLDLVKNITKMYQTGDKHVQVLAASSRNINHVLASLQAEVDIITLPFSLLKEWFEMGMPVPDKNWIYEAVDLKPIDYQELNLTQEWKKFNLEHELTEKGLEKFAHDWNALIKL